MRARFLKGTSHGLVILAVAGSFAILWTPSGHARASDFRTQLVEAVIPGGSTQVVLTAPDDFESVDPDHTIVLISGVVQHAMGRTQETSQTPAETSALVELTDGSTLTVSRATAGSGNDDVWILLIEYVGRENGHNAFVVRDRRTYSWSRGEGTATYEPAELIGDTNDVVVFNAGATNVATGQTQYMSAQVAAFVTGEGIVSLSRGATLGRITTAHQVVEFTGSNWQIQTGEVSPSPDPGGTDVSIEDVGDVSAAWVYFTFQTNAGQIREFGHRVFLTSSTNIRVQEHSTAVANKTVRWYVIANPLMEVQTISGGDQFTSNLTATISGFNPVADSTRSFAWVHGMTNGNGAAHPRDFWQFALDGDSSIALKRGYSGQRMSYIAAVIELPTQDIGTTSFERTFPKNGSILLDDGAVCAEDDVVTVSLSAENTATVLLSEDRLFRDAAWVEFAGSLQTEWTFTSQDGVKTLYALFRSKSADMSTPYYTSIILDKRTGCGEYQ